MIPVLGWVLYALCSPFTHCISDQWMKPFQSIFSPAPHQPMCFCETKQTKSKWYISLWYRQSNQTQRCEITVRYWSMLGQIWILFDHSCWRPSPQTGSRPFCTTSLMWWGRNTLLWACSTMNFIMSRKLLLVRLYLLSQTHVCSNKEKQFVADGSVFIFGPMI